MNALTRPQLVLIDLDGTLVDSVPDLARCVDEVMRAMGRAPHGEARVRDWIGNGVRRLMCRALTNTMHGDPEPALLETALAQFNECYGRHVFERSQLYPGVTEGLERLRAEGYRLACITNKLERFTRPLLEKAGIDHYFELVLSGDSLPKQKPDPLPLLHAARHFGVPASHAMLVGDSINDVQAARAAGFEVVCVSYGYNHGEDIRTAQPDAVIDSLAELPALLERAA